MIKDPFDPNGLFARHDKRKGDEKLRDLYNKFLDPGKLAFIRDNGFCSMCKIRHNPRVWIHCYIIKGQVKQESYCELCLPNSRLYPPPLLIDGTFWDKDRCDFKKKLNEII